MILVELGPDFLLKKKIFLFGDKLLPLFQHGFLRSAENVYLHNLLVLFGKILFHIIFWYNYKYNLHIKEHYTGKQHLPK